MYGVPNLQLTEKNTEKKKQLPDIQIVVVGVRRFERPTTRPPDAYSNRAELHPALSEPAKLIQNFKSSKGALNYKPKNS